jgi:hypothetical protein
MKTEQDERAPADEQRAGAAGGDLTEEQLFVEISASHPSLRS